MPSQKGFARKRPHYRAQKIIGGIFPFLLGAGFFIPWIGFSVVGCMIAGMLIAIGNGRKWCDFWCPRGSFFDAFLSHISPQKPLPPWFHSYWIRIPFILGLFSFLTINIILVWPQWDKIAFAFVKTLTITTILSIILALIFRARAWCILCPVGTFSGLIGGKKNSLLIDATTCVDCKKCKLVCPMGLTPYEHKKTGMLQTRDCIKCRTCVIHCPKKSLCFARDKNAKQKNAP